MTQQHAPPKPGSQTMRLERVFDASPEDLWVAFTRPEQLAKWISPFPGVDAEVHEMDARKGGRVRFTMIDEKGTRYPEEELLFESLTPYKEIVQYQSNAGRSDVFADHPMRMTITLEPQGPRTKLTLVQEGLPAGFPLDMAKGGFSACLDKLAKVVSRPAHGKTLRLERAFDASPADLWAAWTDPRQYAKWFNPAPGMDLVVHEFDVRVGGQIRFDMPQPDGNRNPQEGVFHVLSPHTRIVSGSPDKSFLLDVRLVPEGKRTRMVVEVTGVPPEYHAMATQGWNAGFDKLEALLAR